MRRPKQEKIKVSKKKKIINKLSFHASTSFFSVFSKYPENKINWKDKSAGLYCQSKFSISLCSMSSQNGDNFLGEKKKKSSASEYYHNLLIYLKIFPCCPPWQYIFYPKSINPCPNKLCPFVIHGKY